jgi:hypothetical protein
MSLEAQGRIGNPPYIPSDASVQPLGILLDSLDKMNSDFPSPLYFSSVGSWAQCSHRFPSSRNFLSKWIVQSVGISNSSAFILTENSHSSLEFSLFLMFVRRSDRLSKFSLVPSENRLHNSETHARDVTCFWYLYFNISKISDICVCVFVCARAGLNKSSGRFFVQNIYRTFLRRDLQTLLKLKYYTSAFTRFVKTRSVLSTVETCTHV